jgi:hypothetical protein
MSTELALPATLHKLGAVSLRTGLSRSALYSVILNPKNVNCEIRTNEAGRLLVVHVERSVRVREQDLIEFLDALAQG